VHGREGGWGKRKVEGRTGTDLDLAFGAFDVNDDLACTSLLSPPPLSPLTSPLLLLLLLLGSPSEIREFSLS